MAYIVIYGLYAPELLLMCFVALFCKLDRKNPYEECYDKVKVNEYMDLDSLAKVLNELTEMFPGTYISIYVYVRI